MIIKRQLLATTLLMWSTLSLGNDYIITFPIGDGGFIGGVGEESPNDDESDGDNGDVGDGNATGVYVGGTQSIFNLDPETGAINHSNFLSNGWSVKNMEHHGGYLYAASSSSIKKLDGNLNIEWELLDIFENSDFTPVIDMDIDSSGNTYYAAGEYLLKIDSDGNEVFSISHFDRRAVSVAVDNSGSIYVVGQDGRGTDHYIKKLSPNGSVVENQLNFGNNSVIDIYIDDADNLYTSGRRVPIVKRDLSFNEVWSYSAHNDEDPTGTTITDLHVNDKQEVFAGVYDGSYLKLDSNGELEFQNRHMQLLNVRSITTDKSGAVYRTAEWNSANYSPDDYQRLLKVEQGGMFDFPEVYWEENFDNFGLGTYARMNTVLIVE